MDMHPLQMVAIVLMVLLASPVVFIFGLGFFMFLFPDAITWKGEDSRLIRWPKAIKSAWDEFWDFVDILTSRRRLQEFMKEIHAT